MARHKDVRLAWAGRFDEVLIDEFQDTDPIVVELVRGIGRHAAVVVAGDVDQSIYGWRGAVGSFDALARLEDTHGIPEEHVLRIDYRLPRAIQIAAQRLRGHMARPGVGPNPTRRGDLPDPSWEPIGRGEDLVERLARRITETVGGRAGRARQGAGRSARRRLRRSHHGDVAVLGTRHVPGTRRASRSPQGQAVVPRGCSSGIWLGASSRASRARRRRP